MVRHYRIIAGLEPSIGFCAVPHELSKDFLVGARSRLRKGNTLRFINHEHGMIESVWIYSDVTVHISMWKFSGVNSVNGQV